ncbi:50S ribosome-binding GTPase [Candidatus Woesearchaeota archaeon]|nr:50S ribosome-binding GTPase [Candidatus Woesearchaeota archaeon]
MNFQGLEKIENYKFYIDLAFRKATEKSSQIRGTKLKGTRLDKSRKLEIVKLDTVKEVLYGRLQKLIKGFPDLESLPEFYKELVKATVDYPALKKSLGSLKWAQNKVNEMHRNYASKIKKCRDLARINGYRTEYYGRVSSILKQIKDELNCIEQARRTMREYPSIKTGMKTVAIAGFPNVGKTTLLFRLTGSKPDIQPYAFTTKGINVGYIMKDGKKEFQVLDTPGTLNRFDKMNTIEKVAFLAIKLLAEKIIYVFDLTEPYPLEEQVRLYKNILQTKKQVLVYLSKTDILEKDVVEEFSEEYKNVTLEELKKLIS